MLIGLGGVTAALLVGGSAFYAALTFAVDRTLDNEALASAHEVAALVDAGQLPNPVPVSGAQVVQVVDAEHRVVGGSVTADRLTPLLRRDELATALAGAAVVVPGSRAALSTPLRVRAVTAGPADARVSVLVALPVGDVLASRAALRRGLLIVFPLVLAVMAAVAWRVIGSTLRPVEQLRADAERISGASRAERLAVPAASDEVRALAVTLNSMLDRLAAARARQRSFVADAAHELRSPLTSIRTQLEVAERLGEGGSLPAELLLDVERLTRLVEDLLLLARVDADTRGPARRDLVEVAGLLAVVAADHTGSRVPLRVRCEGSPQVVGDRDELRRAVKNLVDNAVRHAGSAVELAGFVEHHQVRIVVLDDGPGLSTDERERVFERFTRLDDARGRSQGGTGLGLPIARELVARAGGTLTLTDAPPPWSLQAVVALPVAAAE
ncbi:sensor histidine kinase [uncultured Friedmanniella sp.]|uniref:sensor histidine kinase n=1 Tax=uncultured Friedmanniella sp. TaxID=335381 RepID=UPI0035CBB1A8